METKNYSTQLIDCYWMLSIVAILCHFWDRKKMKSYTISNQDSHVTYYKRRSYSSFCFGGETMDEIICEEQWLILTKELIKCTAVTSKRRNLKEFKSAIRHTNAKKAI